MTRRQIPVVALIAALFASLVQFAASVAVAQPSPDPRVAELTRAGKIRVGLFLPQYVKNPSSGEVRSVWVEVARTFAARVGVELTIVEHPTPPEAIACLKSGACDLMFLPLDDRAASIGDFSNPVFQFDYTLLVPEGSAIGKVAEADRAGGRIAAVRNHASTNELVKQIKQAELVYAETPNATFELLRGGQAGSMASTRLALLDLADKLPGSRVLADRYGANINRMVVPKGKAGLVAYLNEFVEEAKASGVVQRSIERGGTRGVTVAAAGNAE
jgi:polar amino acid transport system substrate-binding protein